MAKTAKKKPAAKAAAHENKWTDISGKVRLYASKRGKGKRAFIAFSTSIGSKDPETEEWSNIYVNVHFKRDTEPGAEDGDVVIIDVKNGFLSVDAYENSDGEEVKTLSLVVMDYDLCEDIDDTTRKAVKKAAKKGAKKTTKRAKDEDDEDDDDDEEEDEDDDLPF